MVSHMQLEPVSEMPLMLLKMPALVPVSTGVHAWTWLDVDWLRLLSVHHKFELKKKKAAVDSGKYK